MRDYSNNLIIRSSITGIHGRSQGSPLLAIHKSGEKREIVHNAVDSQHNKRQAGVAADGWMPGEWASTSMAIYYFSHLYHQVSTDSLDSINNCCHGRTDSHIPPPESQMQWAINATSFSMACSCPIWHSL